MRRVQLWLLNVIFSSVCCVLPNGEVVRRANSLHNESENSSVSCKVRYIILLCLVVKFTQVRNV